MAIVQTRTSLWEALAGRPAGQPVGPADAGLWAAVTERLNPAKAMPRFRDGIEEAQLTSVRGVPYVMLRSPAAGESCYLRLTPAEVELAHRMDGTRTVASLVGEFARITGRLAPDQVTRVVADLAANRMLNELPVDVFTPLDHVQRRPVPVRIGRGLLAAAKGQRMVLARPDRLIGFLYRWGGRFLFTRVAAVAMAMVAFAGIALFARTWSQGAESLFLTGDSYAAGGLVLLGLNVFALCCHELGHALAAKHAGRRVPAAGVLCYFGIPSAFVDTTDVWMANRRSRLLTTAAGPWAALTLAGVAQLVAVVQPSFGAIAFKLAFAWYLNSLFNLNPMMALDGYYLLMDWLEIANLRARGMAFLIGSVRRRPRWKGLDREQRIVALYGVLAALWLIVALNLGFRMYKDRVAGLVTAVWRTGWTGRLLLVAFVAGLLSPMLYALAGWLGRAARRYAERWRERRVTADEPRRLDALRATSLARLPVEKLAALAVSARWLHPRRGADVVTAGAALPAVLAVVDGALESRMPGDPVAAIRGRAEPGQLVGIAPALTSAPPALTWRAAGTRLLAIPTAAFAHAIGPVTGPPPAERAEIEALLPDVPDDDRAALVAQATPLDIEPAKSLTLTNPDVLAIVASGVVLLADGGELRRGDVLGPPTAGVPINASSRTRCRLWTLPASSFVHYPNKLEAHQSAGFGVHPPSDYPPLRVPPGPPEELGDEEDRRLLRRLALLVLLVLLLALLAFLIGRGRSHGWAEMPSDRVLLTATDGEVDVNISGHVYRLHEGDQIYVGRGDTVGVQDRSLGTLTFKGGGEALLCARTRLGVDRVTSSAPTGEVTLASGRIVADTAGTSTAFEPLRLDVLVGRSRVRNHGAARFAVGGRTEVTVGDVTRDGTSVPPTGMEPTCGTARSGDNEGSDGTDTTTTAGVTTSTSSTSTTAATEDTTTTTVAEVTTTVVGSTTTTTNGQTTSTTTTTTAPPTDTAPPVFVRVASSPAAIHQVGAARPCGSPTTAQVIADVTDDHDPSGTLTVTFHYQLDTDASVNGTVTMGSIGGNTYRGSFGPIALSAAHQQGGDFMITVVATDAAGNQVQAPAPTVHLNRC